MFFGIPSSKDWLMAEPLEKGWSKDRKYRIFTKQGEHLLLRLSSGDQFEAKQKEYEAIRRFALSGVRMSMPLEFGRCCEDRNTYMLLTWLTGDDLEDVLPDLPETVQYRLGRQAGTILRRLHSLPVAEPDLPCETKKPKKLRQLERYETSAVRIPGDEPVVQYVRERINLIWRERPVYLHGDYHPGNLIYMEDGTIGVIDFNRWEVGDPYEEFYKLESFGRERSVPYCIGQIDAYFDDRIPVSFWETLAVYVAHASLFSVKWAEQFGQEDVDGMVRRYEMALRDYDGFISVIPKWYTSGKDMPCCNC